jgi:hypothetical protein
MNAQPTTRRITIRNPELWLGKYVRNTTNYEDITNSSTKYTVCEWTGKLMLIEEAHYFTQGERDELGDLFNACYEYSEDAAIKMLAKVSRRMVA